MTALNAPPDDEPAKDTPFYKALVCRVHHPDETLHIAATHRHRVAEARAGIPAEIETYQDQCRAALLNGRAENHDAIAAVCLRHAARLQARVRAAGGVS